jgi:hypothetical protein
MTDPSTATTATRAAMRPPWGRTPETRTAATSVAAWRTIVTKRLASESGRLICRAIDAITSSRTTAYPRARERIRTAFAASGGAPARRRPDPGVRPRSFVQADRKV